MTEIIKSVKEMQEISRKLKEDGYSTGFVPTMGFLHEGHLSLARKARAENERVVVSVFVNPTQFGPDEDYDEYPRDLEGDANKLRKIGVEYIFSPEVEDMYPEGYNSFVEVSGVTEVLCGSSRPSFFQGVSTVLTKLFNIIKPDRVYFGKKDYQQLLVVKKMAKDLNMMVEVIGLPIVREEDGLALSSRNKYLNPEERKAAAILYQSIVLARKLYKQGLRDIDIIKKKLIEMIAVEPLAEVDYLEIVDADNLKDINLINGPVLLALAVYIGKTRLIDNTILREV